MQTPCGGSKILRIRVPCGGSKPPPYSIITDISPNRGITPPYSMKTDTSPMFEILRFAQEDRSSLQRHFGVAGDMAPDVDRDGQARNVRGGNLDIHRQCRGFAAEALRADAERIDAF